jgi:hypothetical protein
MSETVSLTSQSVPRKSERIASRAVDGKAVLVVLDARKMHTLNAVGTRVFELCDGIRDVATIAQQIANELGVEPSVVERDAIVFLHRLLAEGAIEVAVAGDAR